MFYMSLFLLSSLSIAVLSPWDFHHCNPCEPRGFAVLPILSAMLYLFFACKVQLKHEYCSFLHIECVVAAIFSAAVDYLK